MLKTFSASCLSVVLFALVSLRSGAEIRFDGKREVYSFSPSSNCAVFGEGEMGIIALSPAIKGESVRLSDGVAAEEVVKYFNARLEFSEETEDAYSEYYYSPYLSSSVRINGKKVNLHIAYSGDAVTVGTPLIFGSY